MPYPKAQGKFFSRISKHFSFQSIFLNSAYLGCTTNFAKRKSEHEYVLSDVLRRAQLSANK